MMKTFVNVLTPFAFGHLRLALVVSHKNPDGERTSTEQTHVIIRLNNNNKNKNNNKSNIIFVIHILSPWGHLRKVSCVGAVPRGNVRVTTARVLQRTFVDEIYLLSLSMITIFIVYSTSKCRCWILPAGPVMSAFTEAPSTGWPPRSTLMTSL